MFGLAIIISSNVFAQQNIIKGRIAYFPEFGTYYSFGIGYERKVTDNISLQLLYNILGAKGEADGPSSYVNGFVPEVRYYVGNQEEWRKKMFVVGFVEIYQVRAHPGMTETGQNDYLETTSGNSINPGILVGKNISIGMRFLIDIYAGYKFKLFNGQQTYRDMDTNLIYYEDYKEGKSGIRVGINLGFAF